TSTGFERVHVPSAPADDGNALGAALLACFEDHPARARPRTSPMSPYLGSTLDAEALDRAEALGGLVDVRPRDVPVEAHAARLLAEGRILGWAQGRAELGPRALGHRSILADPRNPKIKDLINGRVKFREEFRPFAPSILEEYGPEYFEDYQPSPYMERTLVFRPEVRAKVPGVVHEDGTGRLQSVRRDWSPSYHALIEHFRVLTGVPLVLNTSFNVMGKPIIHTVEDALAVFHTTGLDALVLEDRVYEKRRH
ncbi:carbamoyltransferase, partial [Myxococcota bacterium]|nr:carbamoyltransferase [Myxococcota bacterium]